MSALIPYCFHLPFDPMPVFIPFLCWWYHARVYPVPVLILCPLLILCMCFSCPCWSRAYVDPLVHMLILFPWSHACVDLVLMFIHMLFLCMCCSCARVVLVHMLFSCTCCSRAPDVLVHVLFLSQCDLRPRLILFPCWSHASVDLVPMSYVDPMHNLMHMLISFCDLADIIYHLLMFNSTLDVILT